MSCSLRLGLALVFAAAWVFPAVVSAQPEPAKEKKAQSPWLITYSLTTKPGGETFKIAGPVEYFDHNERVLVTEVVTVGEDGTFSLTPEASLGYLHVDQKFRPKDGKTYTAPDLHAAAFFRGTGKITRESIKLDVELGRVSGPREGLGFWTSSAGRTWLLKPERTGPDFQAHGWAPYAYKETRKTSIDYVNAVPRFLPVTETVEVFQLFPEAPDPKGGPSPRAADLALEMKAKVIAEEPVKGDEKKFRPRIRYTSRVTNKGPDKAVGVVLLQHLPGSFTDISAKVSQGTSSGSHQLVCKLDDLASGATATVEVTATSRIEVSKVTIPFRSTAVVRSDVFDPDWPNNVATEVVKIGAKPQ